MASSVTNKYTIKAKASFKAALWAFLVDLIFIGYVIGVAIWIINGTSWHTDKDSIKAFIDANQETYKYLTWAAAGLSIVLMVVYIVAYLWIIINSITFIFAKNSFFAKFWSIISIVFGLAVLVLLALNIAGAFINTKSITSGVPEKAWNIITWVAMFAPIGLIFSTGFCKYCVNVAALVNKK